MAKARSRLLVIDASIARAAGETSQHPTSQHCRAVLQCVLKVCHKVVMTEAITEEWNQHQSVFARRWRGSMMARKKVVMLQADRLRGLEERLTKATPDPSIQAIVIKDRLLVEAALCADERILSNDDRVRRQLREHISSLRELANIHWVNPCADDESAVSWLEQGAPDDRARQLGRRS